LLTLSTYSFPSGHTAGTTLLYGIVAAYVFSRTRNPRLRWGCVAVWILMVVLVGFSRLYLGVHYLTDVVGAVTWSLAWLGLCVIAARELQARSSYRPGD
jgi:undecaprenyl-diphosphatase